MKTCLKTALGFVLFIQIVHSASLNSSENVDTDVKTRQQEIDSNSTIIIDLENINHNMSMGEYLGRQLGGFWDYLLHGSPEEPQSTFQGRCIRLAKKIQQLLPILMIGGGVVVTKLGFLVLFSLKTIGLLGLLLLLNVGSIAAKLGAHLASKKAEQPQNLHVHVQPWKSEEHFLSNHLKGPPYGWDTDRNDDIETHELYNLYEKLKLEQNLRRYLSANGRI